MKMDRMMKMAGLAACLGLALSLTARAEDNGSSTNAPAKHHGGPGLHRGAGGEFGGGPGGGLFGGANREEMQKFRESLKDMTPEQRKEALQKFRQKMAEKIKERIENNDKLTAEQKKDILAKLEKIKDQREKIMGDSSLNEEQKREAMRKLMEQVREDLKKYREALEGPRKDAPAKAGDQASAPKSSI